MPFYQAFNLSIKSEIEIPLFSSLSELDQVDISICLEPAIPQPEYISPMGTSYEYISDCELILGWPVLGWFRVKDGHTISICPAEGVPPEMYTLPLFGLIFATLLQQRQEYVLHGSGVEIDGRGAIFIGDKGFGKSTMASWFMSKGARVVTDDVAALFEHGQKKMLRSGFPQMKLWPNSLETIGKKADDFERIIPELEKRSVAIDSFCNQPIEVGGIFILGKGDDVALNRLTLQEGLMGLARNMMACGFVEGRSQTLIQGFFENGADVLQKVPVYALSRPKNLDLLPDIAQVVREKLYK